MKYRMHKRVETKPDGRTIYYYTFEPAAAEQGETQPDACLEPLLGVESGCSVNNSTISSPFASEGVQKRGAGL